MTLEEAKRQIPPGRYRHFKGNEYEVLDIAQHSETEEPMVVYRALYGRHGLWVRPAEMWLETVERDGYTFRRFTRVRPAGRYVAFDVETPNSRNDRMSAIGVTVIEDGEIAEAAVETEPTFPEIWEKLEPVFSNAVLVAHNATFDLGVLAKCLHAYGIPWQTRVKYACTVRMSRQMHPETENHRLNTMCDCLGIELDHHHAGSDSHACGEILRRYLDEGIEINRFIRTYDLQSGRTLR